MGTRWRIKFAELGNRRADSGPPQFFALSTFPFSFVGHPVPVPSPCGSFPKPKPTCRGGCLSRRCRSFLWSGVAKRGWAKPFVGWVPFEKLPHLPLYFFVGRCRTFHPPTSTTT